MSDGLASDCVLEYIGDVAGSVTELHCFNLTQQSCLDFLLQYIVVDLHMKTTWGSC